MGEQTRYGRTYQVGTKVHIVKGGGFRALCGRYVDPSRWVDSLTDADLCRACQKGGSP